MRVMTHVEIKHPRITATKMLFELPSGNIREMYSDENT